MKVKFQLIILLFTALTFSCKPDDDDPVPPPLNLDNGVLVVNEGATQSENASIDFITRISMEVQHDVYSRSTTELLGDGATSIFRDGQDVWISVTNSGKIEHMKLPDFEHICTLTGIGMYAPRMMLKVGENKAYVSDKVAHLIHIVNLQNCEITGNISTGGWTEEMLLYDSIVYVAKKGSDKVLRINPVADTLIDSIYVCSEPTSLQIDANEKLWVLCSGDEQVFIPRLKRVNPQTMITEVDMPFSSFTEFPKRLTTNVAKENLYYLNNQGLYKMSINNTSKPIQPWIASGGRSFNALGIDPLSDEFFIGAVNELDEYSTTFRYSPQGVLLDSVETGFNTRDFHFLD